MIQRITIFKFILFTILICSALVLKHSNADAADHKKFLQHKKVLLLNSYHQGYLWTDEITRGVKEVLAGSDIELHVEYMDTKRQFDPEYQNLLQQVIRFKHDRHRYDIVICADNNAFDFMKEKGKPVFGDLPIIFCGINYLQEETLNGLTNTTGINEKPDIAGNLSLIRHLHPDCEKIVVICDNTPTGKQNRKAAIKAASSKEHKDIEVEILSDMSVDELSHKMKSLGKNTIVLFTIFIRDRNDHFLGYENGLNLVCNNSKQPVYAVQNYNPELEVVGGLLINGYDQGKQAAQKVREILKGKAVEKIPVTWETPTNPRFNYEQLQKTGIPLHRLPSNSEIINKPISLYHKHKWVIWNSILIFMVMLAGVLGLGHGLIRSRRAEKKSKKSEEQYRDYFEENISGAYITTPEGQLIVCNKEYRKIFGFDNTDLALKTPLSDHYSNSEKRAEFVKIIKDKQQVTGFETTLKKADGTLIYAIENASGVFDNKTGQLKLIRGFIIDITEQKKLEAKYQHAQKMEAIGTLAGGIAHDFNNILGAILGYAQLTQISLDQKNEAHKYIDQILAGCDRAKGLTSQILSFSRQNKPEKKPVDIGIIIKEVLKLIRASLPANIEIRNHVKSNIGIAIADQIQIHQVMLNLCTNALHAMKKDGGILEVTLQPMILNADESVIHQGLKPGRYLKLTVSDSGHGMNATIRSRIFEPYFTTKKQGEGTGMGLSMVHGIIQDHEGAIQVYSEPDIGTSFHILLPCVENIEKTGIKNETTLRLGKERILLVDDEKALVDIGERTLRKFGYSVESKTDPHEALQAFKTDPDKYDLVITDLTMPKMTGERLAKELIQIRPDIPIIVCTGFSDIFTPEDAYEIGIKDFLMKPLTMKDLSQSLRKVLDES